MKNILVWSLISIIASVLLNIIIGNLLDTSDEVFVVLIVLSIQLSLVTGLLASIISIIKRR